MKLLRYAGEFVALSVLCVLFSFAVGTVQHYVAFGVQEREFGTQAFLFAVFEGGTFGVMLGYPTGLIVYYIILRKTATRARILLICCVALIGGVISGMLLGLFSGFATPLLTIGAALYARSIKTVKHVETED